MNNQTDNVRIRNYLATISLQYDGQTVIESFTVKHINLDMAQAHVRRNADMLALQYGDLIAPPIVRLELIT